MRPPHYEEKRNQFAKAGASHNHIVYFFGQGERVG